MRRRSRAPESSNLVRALALFVVLTGAVAFAGTFSDGGDGAAPALSEAAPAIPLALKHIEEATHALEATDYGRTRSHLHEARGALIGALQ